MRLIVDLRHSEDPAAFLRKQEAGDEVLRMKCVEGRSRTKSQRDKILPLHSSTSRKPRPSGRGKYETLRVNPEPSPAIHGGDSRRVDFVQGQNDGKTPFRNNFLLIFFILCCNSCQSLFAQDKVCFQNQCIEVELAQKPEELARGLQFREKLAPHTGMLFVFPRSTLYSFWMKDTKIPLDLIWMDAAQQVVDIKKNVLPCVEDPCAVYTPDKEAMYVLEINSGAADTFQIHHGDTAVFRFNSGKQF